MKMDGVLGECLFISHWGEPNRRRKEIIYMGGHQYHSRLYGGMKDRNQGFHERGAGVCLCWLHHACVSFYQLCMRPGFLALERWDLTIVYCCLPFVSVICGHRYEIPPSLARRNQDRGRRKSGSITCTMMVVAVAPLMQLRDTYKLIDQCLRFYFVSSIGLMLFAC